MEHVERGILLIRLDIPDLIIQFLANSARHQLRRDLRSLTFN